MAASILDGYYSETEYHFKDDEADAIIRTVAYHRRDFALSMTYFAPREHDLVRHSLTKPFPRASAQSLALLENLPPELLRPILLQLDVRSVLTFRQVSLRARELLDALLPEHTAIFTHALTFIRALLVTGAAPHVLLAEVWAALRTAKCDFCPRLAVAVSIPVWRRCCYRCLAWAPQTRMHFRPPSTTSTSDGEPIRSRVELPRRPYRSLPGLYTLNESLMGSGAHLYGTWSSDKPDPPTPAEPRAVYGMNGLTLRLSFMAACALPHYDPASGHVEHGLSCAGCQLAFDRGIIGFAGTEDRQPLYHDVRDRIYARGEYLAHFKRCAQAQHLWEASEGGARLPPELPVGAWTGGTLSRRLCRGCQLALEKEAVVPGVTDWRYGACDQGDSRYGKASEMVWCAQALGLWNC